MSSQRTVLLCLSAAIFLVYATESATTTAPGRSSLSTSNQQEPCTLPHDYSRFHANDSLIGSPVPCTREDKICFRYNLLFDPKQDRCDPIGVTRPLGECPLMPNRTEFENGSGRIIGACREYEDPCPGYRMAYDSRCYPKEVVNNVICGRCSHLMTRNLLGGVECRSSRTTPIRVKQPDESGRCLIPDLRFPDYERPFFFQNPLNSIQGFRGDHYGIFFKKVPHLTCESQQAGCFSQEKMWVSEYKGCHSLLEQGPCPAEHVVALDSQAAFQGRAVATCVHVRGGCPPGHKRMLFDDQCHEDRELKVGAPGKVVWNQYGRYVLIPHGFKVDFTPILGRGYCYVEVIGVGAYRSELVPKPFCGADNSGLCRLYEVESEIPKPEDD